MTLSTTFTRLSATISPRGEIRLAPKTFESLGWSPGTLVSFTYDPSLKRLDLVLGSQDDLLAMPLSRLASGSWTVSAVEFLRRSVIDVPFNRRLATLLTPQGVTLDLSLSLLSPGTKNRTLPSQRLSSKATTRAGQPPALFASISLHWLSLSRALGGLFANTRVELSFDPPSLSLVLTESLGGLPVCNAAAPGAANPTYRISLRQGCLEALGIAVPFQTTRYPAKLLNPSPGQRTAIIDLSNGESVARPRREPKVDVIEAALSRLSHTPLVAELLEPVRATRGHQVALRLLAAALVQELQSFAAGQPIAVRRFARALEQEQASTSVKTAGSE